ncbi:proline iminopeptidase-family hydrolase [Streptomyces alkaliterrae]|uniref:Proline iminopeptidase n=1 Tax=Streptomyces alkaliterrae TaxID=2213162 RepID=A0A7W3ZV45_9ACTN|nr:proline iminopeptidase-family hydrolase [Streptomyces alkaliterrae]MBB1255734.1 proline iminopeptidase-family hydrolase [Streptomyces alkaliterrae]MBB1261626.1 proline iminopeptidase-family hydrolase [Streptomyces alkaliterrae]
MATDTGGTDHGVIHWDGHRTWWERRGSGGVPLLLLPGGPGASSHYLTPLAERLSRERHVVRYDPLGTGHSTRERPADGWTVELFLHELDQVRQRLDLDTVDLLGHSWGGWLALEHLLRGARGVRGLVLYSSSASVPHTSRELRRLAADLPEADRQAIAHAEQTSAFEGLDYQRAVQTFLHRHFCRLDPWPAELNRQGFGFDVYQTLWGPSEITCTGTLADWDVSDRLGDVRVPTLIVSGAHDELTAPLQDELRDGLPDARRVTFADSGHMSHLEEPDRFARTVAEFLATLPTGPTGPTTPGP